MASRAPRTRVVPPGGGVRARTRTLLLDAALRVFAGKDAGEASIHEIASEAGVSNGTFYNYFRTREELLTATTARLATRLSEDITESSAGIVDPAERVAIGCRRFVLEACRDPVWGAALLRVFPSTPDLSREVAGSVLGDLRPGKRRKRFRYGSEVAAFDLVHGTVLAGVRSVVEGRAGEAHASDVACLVLRGLGVAAEEAEALATKPLPPLTRERAPILRYAMGT